MEAGRRRRRHPGAVTRRAGRRQPGSSRTRTSLRNAKISRTRYVDFSESANGNTFFINRKTYTENRVDTTVRGSAGTERWIVRNFSGEMHVFHLHQTEFLVTSFRVRRTRPWVSACVT